MSVWGIYALNENHLSDVYQMCVAYAKCKSSRYATLYIVCIILVTISVKSDHVVTYENVCLNSYKSMLKPYQINIPVLLHMIKH